MSKVLPRAISSGSAASMLLTLHLSLAATAAGAVSGDWSTFMDGTRQTAIAAEGNERLWVSSTGGATAFAPGDSTYLRLFRNDGLPSQDLTSVVVDSNGNRWFGSSGRGLQVQTPAGDFLLRPLDRFDLGSDSLRVLVEAAASGGGAWGDSTVWAGTETGAALVEYPSDPDRPDSAVLLTINIESLLGSRPLVNAIAVRDTITWFGTGRGAVRLTTSGMRSIETNGLTDLDVRSLIFFEGFLWAGTSTSVFRFESGQWVERASGLALGLPYLSFAVLDGVLHVGAAAQATPVYRLDGLTWSPRSSGMVNLNVAGLAAAGGSLWAATSRGGNLQGGLFLLGANDTWRRIPSPDPPDPGLADFDNIYLDVAVVPGTREGRGITRQFIAALGPDGWNWVKTGNQGIESTFLFQVLVDRFKRTWLGHCCCGTGAACRCEALDDLAGQTTPFAAYDISDIAEAPNGDIWLGSVRASEQSDGFGLYRINPGSGTVTNYVSTPIFRMASLSLEALAFDASGQLWIGYTADGVDIWSRPGDTSSSLLHLGFGDGLPSERVTALAAAGSDVWVGTGSGIAIYDGTLLTRVIRGDALPAPQVRDLAVDGCGRIWVATDAGVVVFDGDGSELDQFNDDPVTWPGVVDERVEAIDVDGETGTVWFATQNGLSRLEYDVSCASSAPAGDECTRFCPFPNPFEPASHDGLRLTEITQAGQVRVTVFDATGNQVAAGESRGDGTVWDGRDADGDPVPSGIYLLRIESGGESVMRRVAVWR